jgi:hypothetical protein
MADKEKGPGPALSIVRDAIDNPTPAPKIGKAKGEWVRDDEDPELPFLPPGCPVEPLGVNGQMHYYLDEQRQLIGLDPQKHGKTHILALFGRKSNLCNEFWPRFRTRPATTASRSSPGGSPKSRRKRSCVRAPCAGSSIPKARSGAPARTGARTASSCSIAATRSISPASLAASRIRVSSAAMSIPPARRARAPIRSSRTRPPARSCS